MISDTGFVFIVTMFAYSGPSEQYIVCTSTEKEKLEKVKLDEALKKVGHNMSNKRKHANEARELITVSGHCYHSLRICGWMRVIDDRRRVQALNL